MKQIALAVLNFESAMKFLPPGGPTCVDTPDNDGGAVPSWWVMGNAKQGACYGPNWACSCSRTSKRDRSPRWLRQRRRTRSTCERANPFDVWDMQDKGTRTWRPFHENVSGTMTCPSSGTMGATVPYNDDDDGTSGMALAHLSKANYVACFGGNTMLNAVPPGSTNPVNPDPGFAGIFSMVRIRKNPVGARVGQGTRVAKVADGMSKTVMLSEVLTWNETNDQGAAGRVHWRAAGQRRLARRVDDSQRGCERIHRQVSAEFHRARAGFSQSQLVGQLRQDSGLRHRLG